MKILMIGAHQDDNEFMGGGLAYKYMQIGYTVRFLSLCNGCGGHHIMTKEETKRRRREESDKVQQLLGVEYDVWDIDDCSIVPDLQTRRRLINYIREFSPDLIITHRPNDYHADHRATGQLIQDASYMLIVPHECPETKAMSKMPVIMYFEDRFKAPKFSADIIVAIDDAIDIKLQIAHTNESQVYEWLPYTYGQTVPETENERFEWLKGMNIDENTTDEEILRATNGYLTKFAKPAALYRHKLIEKYGEEKGRKVRFAEVFEICEYGRVLTEELKIRLFPF